jgi:hypothetical protein
MELNSGPEYDFSIKSASLNCALVISISLGNMVPVFYFYALVVISVHYVVDRLSLASLYRLPPKFPLDLTISNVYAVSIGCLFSSVINLYMVGNPLMFKAQEA